VYLNEKLHVVFFPFKAKTVSNVQKTFLNTVILKVLGLQMKVFEMITAISV